MRPLAWLGLCCVFAAVVRKYYVLLISPRAAIICPLQSSCSLCSVFCVPSAPGPRAAEHCRCVHGTCCCTAAGAALYSYHRCDCWSIRRVSGTEKRSVNGSYPSTFFIVIVASWPHVWSDYPMALMIERQDWGLRVINDFESCHHLPNLCAGSPGHAVPVLPAP